MRLLELCRAGKPPLKMGRELRADARFAGVEGIEREVAELVRSLVGFGMLAGIEG